MGLLYFAVHSLLYFRTPHATLLPPHHWDVGKQIQESFHLTEYCQEDRLK
jgi:hypothetical protein